MKHLLPICFALVCAALLTKCAHETITLPNDNVDNPPPPSPAAHEICHAALDVVVSANAPTAVLFDTARNIRLDFDIIALFPATNGFSARAQPLGCEIVDSIGLGYPDAMKPGEAISASKKWSKRSPQVLGNSVGHLGQFEGRGERFLAFRFPAADSGWVYGWVRLDCKQGNSTLRLIDFATYKTPANSPIWAGQTKPGQASPLVENPSPTGMTLDKLVGDYSEMAHDPTHCFMRIVPIPDRPNWFTFSYFKFTWPLRTWEGVLQNGKLRIPTTLYSGNIPSPGGTTLRPYEGSLFAEGTIDTSGQQTKIIWSVDYDLTGFVEGHFHGNYEIFKCN